MIELNLKDRYINGAAVFESYGDTAIMSYRGKPDLPLNSVYTIEGKKWKVEKVAQSDFNNLVVNVNMVMIDG